MVVNSKTAPAQRFERKFTCNLSRDEVLLTVKTHPALFREVYPARFVNNLYLDSVDRRNLHDNLDGIASREKIRIRWYGDLFGWIDKPVLELKRKRGQLGHKISHGLPAFKNDECFSRTAIFRFLRDAHLAEELFLRLLNMEVPLLNRYERRYYASADGCYRITVDSALEYWGTTNREGPWKRSLADSQVILEVKYDESASPEAHRITNYLRFRLARNSKYVNGMATLHPRDPNSD